MADYHDNRHEQKNIDSIKIVGDEMARLELNYDDKEKDEDKYEITFNDLPKRPLPFSSLKRANDPKISKGRVRFGPSVNSSLTMKKTNNELEINTNKNV